MLKHPDNVPTDKKVPITEKISTAVAKLFRNPETNIEKGAFLEPWDEDMCLALKTEIEEKPERLDVDDMITTAYTRLTELLGPHDREGISIENIKNRCIFADPDTINAFIYLYEQPGENSDKYWKNPIIRAYKTRGVATALSLISTRAVAFGGLGVIMIPNNIAQLSEEEDESQQYIANHGINQKEYELLDMQRKIAHELVHFLYSKSLQSHYPLNEPLTDYIASVVFPTLHGVDVRLSWAKAAACDYLQRLGYKSVAQLVHPTEEAIAQPFDTAITVRKKYFGKLTYKDMSWPEAVLNKIGLSKYAPIPDYQE